MKLPFFSRVRIVSSTRFPEYNGKVGVVVGASEEHGILYGYSVSFPYSGDDGLFVKPEEIEAAGEVVDRSLIYDGSRIRVRVVDGEGHLVDETPSKNEG
jgi:hypothetical protein